MTNGKLIKAVKKIKLTNGAVNSLSLLDKIKSETPSLGFSAISLDNPQFKGSNIFKNRLRKKKRKNTNSHNLKFEDKKNIRQQ